MKPYLICGVTEQNQPGVYRNLAWKCTIRTLLLWCRSHTFTVNYVHPSGWFCSAAPHMNFCCVKFDAYLWVIGSFFRFFLFDRYEALHAFCVFTLPYLLFYNSTLRPTVNWWVHKYVFILPSVDYFCLLVGYSVSLITYSDLMSYFLLWIFSQITLSERDLILCYLASNNDLISLTESHCKDDILIKTVNNMIILIVPWYTVNVHVCKKGILKL